MVFVWLWDVDDVCNEARQCSEAGGLAASYVFFVDSRILHFQRSRVSANPDSKKRISRGHKEVSTDGALHVLGQYKRKLGGVGNMWDDQRSAEHAMPQRPVYALCVFSRYWGAAVKALVVKVPWQNVNPDLAALVSLCVQAGIGWVKRTHLVAKQR